MVNEQKRMDVLSNNVANSTTVGFKLDKSTSQAFDQVLDLKIRDGSQAYHNQAIGHLSLGVKIGETFTDHAQGSIRQTGGTYDCALSGKGFFTVKCVTASGDTHTRYTRDGRFTLTKEGLLVDADGNLAHWSPKISVEDACMLSDMVPTGFHGVELADVQFGDTVLVIGIGPVGLMAVAGAHMRGAARILAVGTRPKCVEAAKFYGADEFISYKAGTIEDQVMELTGGQGVDKVIIAGGTVKTFESAVKAVKPGGKIGNVNYLGSGTYITVPRVEWGVGMGHKQILGGLMPGGRLRMEKLGALIENGKLDVGPLTTHVFEGWEHIPEALQLMKDKPADLIKPVVKLA